ncbi:hypothetical protein J4Q44_G00132280 [Coregonus suidteri]|uniref:Sec16 Sec23-binding domain-containing protein n=1 Tax=Coregonus suidteri TaxID=861788 RepID=A0AAN8LSF2_9TELE
MIVPENVGKETERFRELLLFGRKKDALEAAMKGALWGTPCLLASKMDSRTQRSATRFANSLPINDPLQTVYQLMSGRMPASATCCGDEKWGDWRPHLAMVLSNLTHTLDLDTRTITTMGDTLVLSFFQSLRLTKRSRGAEAYEYAQSLGLTALLHAQLPGKYTTQMLNFLFTPNVFKLIYERVAWPRPACVLRPSITVRLSPGVCSCSRPTTLLCSPASFIQMSEKMRFFDPQLKEKADQELFNEPEWLILSETAGWTDETGVIASTMQTGLLLSSMTAAPPVLS